MNTTLSAAIICFILFIIVFIASEAFDRLSGSQIMKLENTNPTLASKMSDWLEQSDAILSVFKLLLFLLISVVVGFTYVVMRQLWTEWVQEWSFSVIVGAIIVVWSLGQIISLLMLYRIDTWFLRFTVPPVLFLANTVLLPFIRLNELLRKQAETWRDKEAPEQRVSAEDEILSVVENYGDHEDNDLAEGEKRMIRGILDLGDMSVREIMKPRVELTAIPATASIEEAKAAFIKSGHSRIPIYGRSVDEIRGIIYAKDFLDEAAIKGKTLQQLSHKPLFIPESKEVGDLLEEIRRLHNHFAVVIDEYGGTSGIVTFEDIIEEIVGDVQDEYDNEEKEKSKPQLLPDGSVMFEARTPISDVNEILDVEIPDTDAADTIGGFICSELGRIPDEGEAYHFETLPLVAYVVKADKRKILKLKIRWEEENER